MYKKGRANTSSMSARPLHDIYQVANGAPSVNPAADCTPMVAR